MTDATPGQVESPPIRQNTGQIPEADKARLFKRAVGDLYGEKKLKEFKSKGPKLSGLQKMADWMNSDEVKKMGVGVTLVQGIEADRAKKQQEEKERQENEIKEPSPAPVSSEDDGKDTTPQEVFIPEPLKTDFGVGIVSDPTRIEQEIGGLAQHDRSREKPGRDNGLKGVVSGLISPIIHPIQFGRNFVQNTLFKGSFDARSMGFSRSMMEIARTEHAGLDSSIPLEMPQEILDKSIEEGRKIKEARSWLARLGLGLGDVGSGLTGFYENSDMRYAEKWFKENGKELIEGAKKTSLSEQTELGERFALRGDNKDVISNQVGETRYKLDEVVTDKPVRDGLQTKIKELVASYAKGTINDEELLKQFNVYYHKEVLPHVSADKQQEITGTKKTISSIEVSSNILRIAKEMKVEDKVAVDETKTRYQRYQDEKADDGEAMWNKIHFDIYLGKGKYEVSRGEARLTGLEKNLIHNMVERDYKINNDLIQSSVAETLNDVGIYGLTYVVGGTGAMLVAGKSFFHVGGMALGSVVAGAREGFLFSKKGGKLVGLRGKAVNDFEQVSRETASGRKSKEDAKLRPMFEKAMVDQVKATDLIGSIDSQLQKEILSVDEQKQLLQVLAHAKARMNLTDLSTQKGKAWLDMVGEISVAQNFIGFSADNNNAEMTALRVRIIQGGLKLGRANPELYGKLNDCQAVYEAQLRVGSFEDKVVLALARDTGITQDEARAKFSDLFEDLGIDNKDRKSLEASSKTLAGLVRRKAFTTAAFALAVSPIIGGEMKLLGVGADALGEVGRGIYEAATHHGAEWSANWALVGQGQVPLTYDADHNLQSGLSPLQKDVLAVEKWIKPPSGADHIETIDTVQVVLPGGVQHGFIQDHPDQDALIDTRTGEVLVHMDRSTLFYNEQGELMVTNDVTGESDKASVVFTAFEENGIHLVPDPSHNSNVQGSGETIFHAGTLHEDSSVVVDGKSVSTTIPDNTHWVKDGDKWDLKSSDDKTTLIDNVTIKSNGEIDIQGAKVDSTVQIEPVASGSGGETTATADLWGDISKHNYRIVWGESENIKPDHNSIFFTGDGTGTGEHSRGIQITFEDDQIRNPNGNMPLTTLGNEYDKENMAVLFEVRELHGVSDGQVLVKDVIERTSDGKFALTLDPTNTTKMVTIISGGNEIKISMAELAQNILNEKTIIDLPEGSLDSEFYGKFDVFNLGNDGRNGIINMGFITEANWLKNDKYGADFENIGGGEEMLFMPVHMMSGSNSTNNSPVDIAGGEPNYQSTITIEDIVNPISGGTQLGYKIEYDQSTNLLLNFFSGLRPIPIRENVEKSVRGEVSAVIPPIPQSTPTPTPQPEPEEPKDATRKKLEKIAAKIQDREKLFNLPVIKVEQLDGENIVEGRVFESAPIKYDTTTPDKEEEYEIYSQNNEIYIRAVLENPNFLIKYLDEDNKSLISVKADHGIKLEKINTKNDLKGTFLIGNDFYWINTDKGIFSKVSKLEVDRIKKLEWFKNI